MPKRVFKDLLYNADIHIMRDLQFKKEQGALKTRPDLIELLKKLESFDESTERENRLLFVQKIFIKMFNMNGKLI